ncbi:ABC transporter ATP-binding protein [Undibacter mobilis]|nr:ABC transporter ATP-binding protein [Undibacter mobilis]
MIASLIKLVQLAGVPRRQWLLLVVLSLGAVTLDALGISMFLPLLAYINGGMAAVVRQAPWPLDAVSVWLTSSSPTWALEILLAAASLPMIARYGLMYLQQSLMLGSANDVTQRLRERLHNALLRSDLGFLTSQNSGALLTQVLTYPQQVGNGVQAVADFAVHVLLVAGYAAVLLYLSPTLAFVVAPIIAIIMLFYRGLMTAATDAGRKFNDDSSRLTVEVTQQFQGLRIIKLHFREQLYGDRFAAASRRNLDLYFISRRINLVVSSTINPLLVIAGVIMIYAMVRWSGAGLAQLGVFAVAMLRLLPVIATLNIIRANLFTLLPSMEIYERSVRAAKVGRVLRGGDSPLPGITTSIRFDNVSFDYNPVGEPAVRGLESVSLDIPARKTIALVGRSGAGKSTLVDLLARLYDPSAGAILLDGKVLTEYRLSDLRSRIALVSQDSFMFDATIRENILFGKSDAISDATLESALKRAHAWQFVSQMPHGVDTPLAERGTRLSGGQRQRLALARGLAQQPDLLILDEPTSALDSESEEEVRRALDELHGSTTIVIVAHRLSTIRNADLIYVLDGGKLVASGPHDELMQKSPLYQRLFEAQLPGK